ncbi:MAG: 1-acyl-sn-glycerol-3-phosphate acyltransferase [Gammaproteobacteria bacterium]|nr:1-acyl-sn-glycerol-3-phosphate acyltransferase [Gammaproteobacteria bacterium]
MHALWAIAAWLAFVLAALIAFLSVLVIPTPKLRHRVAKLASRAIFVLPRIKVVVTGRDNLPPGSSVVVANHASYIDGILLKAYLPSHFSFVIKGEMRDIPVVHFVLRRSGAKFVERNRHSESARDARQIVKAAQDGESLGFFPEGTFLKEPGVSRFRPGAFVAAVRGRMPVVPIAIRGTRYMLPAGRLLPRPNVLEVDILAAIEPDDPDFGDARKLAETARQRILAVIDEPDLDLPSGGAGQLADN